MAEAVAALAPVTTLKTKPEPKTERCMQKEFSAIDQMSRPEAAMDLSGGPCIQKKFLLTIPTAIPVSSW
jgi:hypothetical protein